MPLKEHTIRQLMVSRHLYYLAKQNIESGQSVALISGINLLQDAIESFFGAASSVVSAGTSGKPIMDAFNIINAKLTTKLPFKDDIEKVNKLRTNAKHYGLQPDKKETERLLTTIKEFLRESVKNIFDIDFWTLSLLELLEDGEIKQALSAAQAFIAEEEHLKCLIECRKVIFIAFEQRYNVAMFRGSGNAASSLLMAFSSAPYYAKNPDYIAKNVSDPFGLIVLDHSELDRDLLKKKIDPEVFWNIWRGTPAVYRYETKAEWLVSRNLKIEDNGLNQEHSSYILEQTVEIALNLEGARKSAKYFGSGSFVVKLKSDGIKIYAKADKKSEVAFTVEDGLRELGVTESLPGFDGKIYWKVSHSTFDETQGGRFYYGYLLDEDVDWNAT